jgi:hypothetical protein
LRATKAAFALLQVTPPEILNMPTTGAQPFRNSCLHLASAGSDKGFARAKLVGALLDRRADLEQKESNGNTAFLLASGQGATDVFELLMDRGANKDALNNNGFGGFQLAVQCSTSSRIVASRHGVQKVWKQSETKAYRQHHGGSYSRTGRHMQQHATNMFARENGHGWYSDRNGYQWSSWKSDGWQWQAGGGQADTSKGGRQWKVIGHQANGEQQWSGWQL